MGVFLKAKHIGMLIIMASREDMKALLKQMREVDRLHLEATKSLIEIYDSPPHKLIARSIKGLFSKNKK